MRMRILLDLISVRIITGSINSIYQHNMVTVLKWRWAELYGSKVQDKFSLKHSCGYGYETLNHAKLFMKIIRHMMHIA